MLIILIQVNYKIPEDLAPYINCIMIGESFKKEVETSIPLYADGYPGIMFQQAENGFYLLPKRKKLSELFLYGQTIQPISLNTTGVYQYIVIQLYPFASKYLLDVNPKLLNDDCYDLLQIDYLDVNSFKAQLVLNNDQDKRLHIIYELIRMLIRVNKQARNNSIERAIKFILEKNGRVKIKDVLNQVYMTERTLERHFKTSVGLTPKQFAKIIQFQTSLNKLTKEKYNSLIAIGIDSGFSDQSHFIRTFKSYTGKTPSYYLKHYI
ncbi:AraC family transcriptional regulator [Tenacibaculum sp. 190524A02b]|uniref:AraC family transcriptional regulator n=1 Tax=Tenacibaculum vairaonense TaxID=3137860 RepID=A0ABP1FBC0_9FLAO